MIVFFTFSNLGLLNLMASDEFYQPMLSRGWPWINTTDPSSVSIAEYREWYSHHSSLVGANITDCSLEEEMNKVPPMLIKSIGLDFVWDLVPSEILQNFELWPETIWVLVACLWSPSSLANLTSIYFVV